MYDLVWQNKQVWKQLAETAIPAPPSDPAISKAVLLMWEEHCVECAEPQCYKSCSLYVPRRDQRCARFVYGIAKNNGAAGLLPYSADIMFRRWAKIEANWHGIPNMVPVSEIRAYADRIEGFGTLANYLADILSPLDKKRHFNRLYGRLLTKWNERRFLTRDKGNDGIDGFFVKVYLADAEEIDLQIEIIQNVPVFRGSIRLKPGWNEHVIPLAKMNLNLGEKGRIAVWPSIDREVRLLFAWLDFVQLQAVVGHDSAAADASPRPADKVKCLVWDLDNTLWEGVIGDVGKDSVKPNANAIALVKQLDERGIIQSIASKNTFDIAWPKIEELGLSEYFLYPAINWGRKSESIRGIAQSLNINLDTLAVIDDSPFEHGEIVTSLPQVRVYDPLHMSMLLHRAEFNVPITEASRERRLSYFGEIKRKRIAASWGDNYEGFLRSCEITIKIGSPSEAHKSRCLELLQRTNQLNLSCHRYSSEEFERLLSRKDIESFVFECADRYGNYGVVGFMSVEIGGIAPAIKDFVVSCRVAAKQVEQTVISWYAKKAQEHGADCLRATFTPTDRNDPIRKVLGSFPFRHVSDHGNERLLEYKFPRTILVPDVLHVSVLDKN